LGADLLEQRATIDPAEFESLFQLMRSRLDLSLARLLSRSAT
jgi:hypothetical protein